MYDKKIFKETFSELRASEETILEVLKMTTKNEKHFRQNRSDSPPRKLSKTFVAAALISMLLIVTAAAAAWGGFNWFTEKFNPAYGDIAQPVEAWCEDQGIRMEVIGAQKYDDMAVVYYSLQDISGQNRITEDTDFKDGFNVKINAEERTGDGPYAVSYSYGCDVLYFDEETNTAYYELVINNSSDEVADPLTIGSTNIYFDSTSPPIEGYWKVAANLSDQSENMCVWTDITAGPFRFEYLSLSPLGVRARGSCADSSQYISQISVSLETPGGIVELSGGSGQYDPESGDFNFGWTSDASIEVGTVTAVIINDTRVTVH